MVFLVTGTLLAACGGTPPHPATPEDTVLQNASQAGRMAFSLQRPGEAASQFEKALVQAQARDDAGAIGDYGYNLAVAYLAANHPTKALAAARRTHIALANRGVAAFPGLILVEANALYRLGDRGRADGLAAYVEAGGDASAAAQAAYLRGLIAAESGDRAGLDAAVARLQHPTNTAESANVFELIARRDLTAGYYARAGRAAGEAVNLRRTNLDYRGMARALAVDAQAAAGAGDRGQAAALYIRAAQSAAAQGDADAARRWSRQALAEANTPIVRQVVHQTLDELPKDADGPAKQ